jgi:hypothetical protein
MGTMWHDSEGVFRLIDQHVHWCPSMEPRDVYKLLYQGVLGPEHNIRDESTFRERLLAEFTCVDAGQAGRVYEPVRPDRSLLRINLRPFKLWNGAPESLIEACLSAGQQEWGSLGELRLAWDTFCGFCQEDRWPAFGVASVSVFSDLLEARGYPAVHHSAAYKDCYRPLYRLIATTAMSVLPSDPRADCP